MSMAGVIAEAYKLQGICVAAHIDREKTGFDMFTPGFQNWKRDIICSPGLFGLECDAVASLDWYSDSETGGDDAGARKTLFTARAEVGALKGRVHLAHIQGSDSHKMTSFNNSGAGRLWTRMKLTELTWEGFRTAMIDPTARVRAKQALPKAIPRVRGIAMTGGFLNGEIIHFSDNLNCFIGGRGTGKSTAVRALAYTFGLNDEFGEYDNCPDSVAVYCEDGYGILYRYDRPRGGDVTVKAKEDGSITDVPFDSFRVEYLGQGALAEISKDPLNSPQLLQSFLDRYISLRDLSETEQALVGELRENAATLEQIEGAFSQLRTDKKTYAEIEQKLKIAEESKLKDIVGLQSQVSSERTIRNAVELAVKDFNIGLSLSKFERDFPSMAESAGEVTTEQASVDALQSVQETLTATNEFLKAKTLEINRELKLKARELETHCTKLKASHASIEATLAPKIADLKEKGLAPNIAELEALLRQKTRLGSQIAAAEKRAPELKELRDLRDDLRKRLKDVRAKLLERRKAQLVKINANLGSTLRDYVVFLRYDDSGIVDEFLGFIKSRMTGSYFQEQTARQLCSRVSPSDLADWIRKNEPKSIEAAAGIALDWAEELIGKMRNWNAIFQLQALAKPPKPLITVRTKSTPPKEIPVVQLSDGQRHTILLTIAILADSNLPLVIDQPEDDLDNAFISSSIVATLRAVKERRQVILVTHNANIAVLGDSELILPMERANDCGRVVERGSIDKTTTKMCVQNILEGGPDAFSKRREIYGH